MVEVYNESVYNLLASPTEIHEKLQVLKKGKTVIVPVHTYIHTYVHTYIHTYIHI